MTSDFVMALTLIAFGFVVGLIVAHWWKRREP